MPDPIRISLARKEQVVEMEGLDGQVRTYTLRELYGDERDNYLNALMARTKVGADGKVVGAPDVKNIQAGLISKCLYDEQGAPVPLAGVQKFPASAQETLFRVCEEMNLLTEEARERVKKASAAAGQATASTGFE